MVRRRGWGRGDYGDRYGGYGGFPPYVPVAQRRAKAAAYAKALEKRQGRKLAPITVEGRKIASSFWGQAWCDNLESYSDFANRLPRGRTYVRNGSVIDLSITPGAVKALVSGSEVYNVEISISTLPAAAWKGILRDCARSISSLIDLLQGRFDRGVMERLSRPDGGLFPKPKEIKMRCSCPDYAGLCKHIAAVLYGVGARLDQSPELLFLLRSVDHLELVGQAVAAENLDRALAGESDAGLQSSDLGEIFGIELESNTPAAADAPSASEPNPDHLRAKKPAPKQRRDRTPAKGQGAERPTRGTSAVTKDVRAATFSKSKRQVQVANAATGQKKRLRSPTAQASRK